MEILADRVVLLQPRLLDEVVIKLKQDTPKSISVSPNGESYQYLLNYGSTRDLIRKPN